MKEFNFEESVSQLALSRYGSDFSFRKGQLEAICDILETYFKGEQTSYLLHAPTGSGKSTIALLVSDFINRQNLKGYILTSDISLFDQYVVDIKNNFSNFGYLKGTDNYYCTENYEKFPLGECRIKNLSYQETEKLGCYNRCLFFSDRKKAIQANTSLLTYSLWLLQRNYVEPRMKDTGRGVPFPKRDFTICDEAHKVVDIVQNHFSPKFNLFTVERAEKLDSLLKQNKFSSPGVMKIRRIFEDLKTENDKNKVFHAMKELELKFLDLLRAGNYMKEQVSERFDKTKKIPKEWLKNFAMVDFIKDTHCKFEDYAHIISQTGLDSMIVSYQDESFVFNCLNESYMMQKYFFNQSAFTLLCSATLGDPASFMKNSGMINSRFYSVENSFDYEKSPIYCYRGKRMSMKHKEKSLPWLVKKIEEILEIHKEEKGIIHSGSYELTGKIYSSLSAKTKKRIVFYNDSTEKKESLETFINSKNKVLIGPSLTTGLDLKDDLSRFQIFGKVPFPSLGNPFVKAKMENDNSWYQWVTSTQILQGVGRSVRNESDYATTYLLDGCFADIIGKHPNFFDDEFMKRLQMMSSN